MEPETMASDPVATTPEPLQHMAFTVPGWMKRGEKRLFRSIVQGRFEAKEQPTTAELDRIADYIAARGRIETLRGLLAKDEREIAGGSQSTSTKSRILQTTRQLDAAEKQSHQLAADLGLI
jgi:hypothetical protein